MGMRYHYFYKASLYLGSKPVNVCGTFSICDRSDVFNIENVMDYIGVKHNACGRCKMVHSLSYLGESEDDLQNPIQVSL